jgi:thioredoxin-related protein
MTRSFSFVKVDIDEVASRQGHSSGQELAEKYPVRSAPAQAILDSEATVLRRIRGYVKTDAFLKELSGLDHLNKRSN